MLWPFVRTCLSHSNRGGRPAIIDCTTRAAYNIIYLYLNIFIHTNRVCTLYLHIIIFHSRPLGVICSRYTFRTSDGSRNILSQDGTRVREIIIAHLHRARSAVVVFAARVRLRSQYNIIVYAAPRRGFVVCRTRVLFEVFPTTRACYIRVQGKR